MADGSETLVKLHKRISGGSRGSVHCGQFYEAMKIQEISTENDDENDDLN